jgi:hypothetical protein
MAQQNGTARQNGATQPDAPAQWEEPAQRDATARQNEATQPDALAQRVEPAQQGVPARQGGSPRAPGGASALARHANRCHIRPHFGHLRPHRLASRLTRGRRIIAVWRHQRPGGATCRIRMRRRPPAPTAIHSTSTVAYPAAVHSPECARPQQGRSQRPELDGRITAGGSPRVGSRPVGGGRSGCRAPSGRVVPADSLQAKPRRRDDGCSVASRWSRHLSPSPQAHSPSPSRLTPTARPRHAASATPPQPRWPGRARLRRARLGHRPRSAGLNRSLGP